MSRSVRPLVAGLAALAAGCSHAAPAVVDWTSHVRSCASADGGPGLGTLVASVVQADVTGDGRSEWLVVSECSSKTSRWPQQVEVFAGPVEAPRRIATLLEDDPASPRDITVSVDGGRLVLTGRGLTEDAPACCPDLQVRRVYTITGGRFALIESVDSPS